MKQVRFSPLSISQRLAVHAHVLRHIMPSLAEEFWGLEVCNYSAMGALVFTAWDMCITIGDEVEEIWPRQWNMLKVIYFFVRYFSLFSQLISAIISMRLSSGHLLSERACQALIGFQGVASQILVMTTQIVLILRVKALYHSNRFIHYLLPIVYILELVTMSIVIALVLPSIEYGFLCVSLAFPPLAIIYLLLPLVFETLLFALTMYKFYQASKEGWARKPLIARFMADGIWAFLLPCAVMAVNTCCIALLDSSVSSVAYTWQIAIPAFAGYRLILNMSHLLKYSSVQDYTGLVLLDTAVSLYLDETPVGHPAECDDEIPPLTPMTDATII